VILLDPEDGMGKLGMGGIFLSTALGIHIKQQGQKKRHAIPETLDWKLRLGNLGICVIEQVYQLYARKPKVPISKNQTPQGNFEDTWYPNCLPACQFLHLQLFRFSHLPD